MAVAANRRAPICTDGLRRRRSALEIRRRPRCRHQPCARIYAFKKIVAKQRIVGDASRERRLENVDIVNSLAAIRAFAEEDPDRRRIPRKHMDRCRSCSKIRAEISTHPDLWAGRASPWAAALHSRRRPTGNRIQRRTIKRMAILPTRRRAAPLGSRVSQSRTMTYRTPEGVAGARPPTDTKFVSIARATGDRIHAVFRACAPNRSSNFLLHSSSGGDEAEETGPPAGPDPYSRFKAANFPPRPSTGRRRRHVLAIGVRPVRKHGEEKFSVGVREVMNLQSLDLLNDRMA